MAQPSKSTESVWNFTAGIRTTPQLQEGKAKLIVEANSNDRSEKRVVPNAIWRWLRNHRLSANGRPGDVQCLGQLDRSVGDQKFRAWPMPGDKPGLFSLYAFAWNMPTDTVPLSEKVLGNSDCVDDEFPEGSSINPLIQGKQAVTASLRLCADQKVRKNPSAP